MGLITDWQAKLLRRREPKRAKPTAIPIPADGLADLIVILCGWTGEASIGRDGPGRWMIRHTSTGRWIGMEAYGTTVARLVFGERGMPLAIVEHKNVSAGTPEDVAEKMNTLLIEFWAKVTAETGSKDVVPPAYR